MSAGQLPPPGTVLRKIDRNGTIRCEAVVGEGGQVVYRGVAYSSISAAARVAAADIGLTARSCDGYAFWGLKNRSDAPRAPRSAVGARAPSVAPTSLPLPLPLPLPVRWDDLPAAVAPTEPAAKRVPLTSEIVLETVFDHSKHGRADERGAPLEPDCACRNTTREEACAQAGCGYCRAAQSMTRLTGSPPVSPNTDVTAIASQVRFPGDKTAVLSLAPDIDASSSVDLLQRGAVLVQALDDLADARARQALDIAYGNLACSTNHKLPAKEFDAWAISRTWWDREPVDDRLLPAYCLSQELAGKVPDEARAVVQETSAPTAPATQNPPRIVERDFPGDPAIHPGPVSAEVLAVLDEIEQESALACNMIAGYKAAFDYDKDGCIVGVEPGDEIDCGKPAVKQVVDDPSTRLCADCATVWETVGDALEPIATAAPESSATNADLAPIIDEKARAASAQADVLTQDRIVEETSSSRLPECTCYLTPVGGDGQAELVEQRDPNCPLGAVMGQHPIGGFYDKRSLLMWTALSDGVRAKAEDHVREIDARAAIAAVKAAEPVALPSLIAGTIDARDVLGQRVREVWVAWAREQPAPKRSWLLPWEQISEPDREVDRRIGEALFKMGVDAKVFAAKIGQGSAHEGALAAPASNTEGERRQDAGVAVTAGFSPLRQPEPTGPAPAPDQPQSTPAVDTANVAAAPSETP